MAAVGAAVRSLARRKTAVLTLDTLTTSIAGPGASEFMRGALPPLLARMAVRLEGAPASLAAMPALGELTRWYGDSAVAVDGLGGGEDLAAALNAIERDGNRVRGAVFDAMAGGGGDAALPDEAAADAFLDDFYARRLTLRLLLGQYRACAGAANLDYQANTFAALDRDGSGVLDSGALSRARSLYDVSADGRALPPPRPSVCGLVDRAMAPLDVAVQAVADVQAECARAPGNPDRSIPPFTIHGLGQRSTLPYLPRHLYRILRDVLRNAARATLLKRARAARSSSSPLEEIAVVVSDGADNDDVVVKVADNGGGIPRSRVKRLFSFAGAREARAVAAELADPESCRALGPESLGPSPPDILHEDGGHGLPVARVYARFFNGDIRILSMEGHGTDAYVYISKVDNNVLPT